MIRFNNILAAYDFSENGDHVLEAASRLARDSKARLHIIYVQVIHDDPFMPVAAGPHHERIAESLDARISAIQQGADSLPVESRVVRAVSAAPAVTEAATEIDADLIVVGTHGRRGLRRLVLGSVAEEVVRTAPCPVLTVHKSDKTEVLTPGPDAEILVPVDFSTHSLSVIPMARELAAVSGARLRLLHVVEEVIHPAFYNAGAFSIYDLQPDVEDRALEHLKEAYSRQFGPAVPVVFEVVTGHPAVEIVETVAAHGSGMIVMATHGLGGMAHVFLGSVAERVVRTAGCPVLTAKIPLEKDVTKQPRIKAAAKS